MRWKFNVSHETTNVILGTPAPEQMPPLEDWTTNTEANRAAWTTGPNPSVSLHPVSGGGDEVSEILWAPFDFEDGENYTVSIDWVKDVVGSDNTPRFIFLRIYNNIFTSQFSASDAAFNAVGDASGTITLSFTATSACTRIGLQCQSSGDVNVSLSNFDDGIPDDGTPDSEEVITEAYNINEPDGWLEATLKLARDKDFYSLIEFFDGSFIFYGDNGIVNGGLHIIKKWERLYGPDVTIVYKISFAADDYNFISIFIGQLDLSLAEEMPDNKIRIPVIRDNVWAKFYNRKETQVNIQANVDLDGNEVVSPVESVRLTLLTQKIQYNGEYTWNESVTYPDLTLDGAFFGLQVDWDTTVIDDFRKFNIPRVPIDIGNIVGIIKNDLVGLFEAPWDGDYRFEMRVEMAEYVALGNQWSNLTNLVWFYLQKTNQTSTSDSLRSTETTVNYGGDSVTVSVLDKTIKLRKGEQVAILGYRGDASRVVTIFGQNRLIWKQLAALATTSNITLSGEQTIDGIMTSNTIVLVKDQGAQEENGLYISGPGAWIRAADLNESYEFVNAAVFVTTGNRNAQSSWRQDQDLVNIGVDPNTWSFMTSSDEHFKAYPGTSVDNHLNVTAQTVYKNTHSDGFLVHDAGAGILKSHGIGDNPFYSEIFGSALTNARIYDEDGCLWNHITEKGLQLRGYNLNEKPNSMSFMQWWGGLRPIFNLGLSYDRVLIGNKYENVIRVEPIEHFYDPDFTVRISNIRDITRKYDTSKLVNKVSIGYSESSAESINGIDDPQTKRTYATGYQKIGEPVEIYSQWIAASLAIEQTRRQSINKSTDYKFDNNDFIVEINPDDTSPDSYLPELGGFDVVSGLLNQETRYNKKLTPARNLLRFRKWLNGGLQSLTNKFFKFVWGDGNYDMTSSMILTDCLDEDYDGLSLSEKDNIPVTEDLIHTANYYAIKCPLDLMDYLSTARNRKKAIGISLTGTNHVSYFIDQLDFKIAQGTVTMTGWTKEFLDLSVIEGPAPTQDCQVSPPVVICQNAITDELFEILTDENGECITF